MTSPLATPAPWDTVSASYADVLIPIFEDLARPALEAARVGPSSVVLDTATGPGTLALLAAERAQRVVATDFAPQMIARLRDRVAARGAGNVEAHVMDSQALDLADGTFDAAFAVLCFMFYPDRSKAFAELRRVLKPGGSAVMVTWPPMGGSRMISEFAEAMSAAMPDTPRPLVPLPLTDTAACAAEMSAAGFREVTSREIRFTLEAASAERYFVDLARSSAPIVATIAQLGPVRWAEVSRAAIAHLEKKHGTGPVRLEGVALLTHGLK